MRMRWYRFVALIAWTCLFHGMMAVAADVAARAWLDRDTMQLGETVTLNVEVDAGATAEPDFSALATDFTLLGTQSSRQFSIVNGQTSAKTLWAVGLEPRRAGTLAIPALTVGGATTEPLTLTVLAADAGTASAGTRGDVFVEAVGTPTDPWVQQQVRYSVRLYYAIDLTEGALDEPQADGALIQKLGRDRQYFTTLDGRRYHVLERNYALTPERSGPLQVAGPAFRGTVADASDPTGFFRRGRAVSARAEPLSLDVRAKPASWGDAPWLPAAALTLSEESPLPSTLHIGEPLTRTITLRAQGLGFEQLPELAFETPAGAEVYPDKSETATHEDGGWLAGERRRKFAFVPNRTGTLVLPALRVRWWNTQSDRAEVAELPAATVTVLPPAGAASASAAPTLAPGTEAVAAPSAAVPADEAPDVATLRRWQALALIAFALWLATAALWWRSRRAATASAAATAPAARDVGNRAVFLRACALGDLAGAERALVAWARGERGEVRNLGELAQALDDTTQVDALAALQCARYAGATEPDLGARLTRAFRAGPRWRATPVAEPPPLPPLYPSH